MTDGDPAAANVNVDVINLGDAFEDEVWAPA